MLRVEVATECRDLATYPCVARCAGRTPYARRGIIDYARMSTIQSQNISTEKRWYALKVFYNRVFAVEQILSKEDVKSYIPIIEREVKLSSRIVRRREPAVSSLMFVYETAQFLQQLQSRLQSVCPFMLYYDREAKQPAPISDHEMNIFMLVTSSDKQGLEYIDENAVNFTQGSRVRVTGGEFEGAEGYIHRIKGNRRLIVKIEGVVAVATTYIPSCFLEKLD